MENPSNPRTEVSATAGGLDLSIGPKRKAGRWSLLWAPIWVVFWVYGMYGSIKQVTGAGDATSLILPSLTLAALVVCGVAGFLAFLWGAFGREVVEVSAGSFVVSKELRGFRYRFRSFNTLDVDGLRADGGPGSLRPLLQLLRDRAPINGKIAFEARGATYRFGADLEEDEAREIMEHIKRCLPNMRGHE